MGSGRGEGGRAWERREEAAESLQSPGKGRSSGLDWRPEESGAGSRRGLELEGSRRREVLPSCWRGVSCFPPRARVKLMSESLARTDRRHPPRAHTLARGTEPQPPEQLSSAAGGLLRASKLPGSPATSGRHLCPARSGRRRHPERATSPGTARGPRGSVRGAPGAGL